MTVFLVAFMYGNLETARYDYVQAPNRDAALNWAQDRFTDPNWTVTSCRPSVEPDDEEVYQA